MKIHQIVILCFSIFIISCAPSADTLLSEAESLMNNGEYFEAKEKINKVIYDYNDNEAERAETLLENLHELEAYDDAEYENTSDAWQTFINNYPNHSKAVEITGKITELELQEDYDEASELNTSTAWFNFIEKYPNHPEYDEIEANIIDLAIDEILADKTTGKLPSFDKSNSTSISGNSTVSIKNDTGYPLTIRYRGSVTRASTIARGATGRINIPSGSYTITASANGLNYAGQETLNGNYTSSYYITTY